MNKNNEIYNQINSNNMYYLCFILLDVSKYILTYMR